MGTVAELMQCCVNGSKYGVDRLVAINLLKPAQLAIVGDYRSSLLIKRLHPLDKDFFGVVWALHQMRAVVVAAAWSLRRLRINIENTFADGTDASSRDALQQLLIGHYDTDRDDGKIRCKRKLRQCGVEKIRLIESARVAI